METIRIGVIGAGGIAQRSHIPAYLNTPGVELVAIADINEKKLNYVADKFGIPRKYIDYHELLAQTASVLLTICMCPLVLTHCRRANTCSAKNL